MKRNTHSFQFSGKQIADAAAAERDYHSERLAFWRTEQEAGIAKAKDAGIEVKQVQIVIDPSLSQRLSECASKINGHRLAADRFNIEAAVYATQAARMYECEPEDVIYFRLASGARED